MSEDITALKKKLADLKYKELEETERARLKKEIWRMEHKGIRKAAGIIEGSAKRLGKGVINTFKFIGKKANEYDKKIDSQKVNKPSKLNEPMEELNYLP